MLHFLGLWGGPLIALVLALRIRSLYLVILGLLAMAGFLVSWHITESLYARCETDCPPNEHRLAFVNWFLLTVSPSLLLAALLKYFRTADRLFPAKPS